MKVELIDNDCYKVFINASYIKDFNIEDKDKLGKYVKMIILKLKKLYDLVLEGFYEVHIYYIKYIGIILEINNIDTYISKTIDLKIVVHNDLKYYLKSNDFDLIKDYKHAHYYNNYFYLDIGDIGQDDIIKIVEQVEIVNEDNIKDIKNKWYYLTF